MSLQVIRTPYYRCAGCQAEFRDPARHDDVPDTNRFNELANDSGEIAES